MMLDPWEHKAMDNLLRECARQGIPVTGGSGIYGAIALILTELLKRTAKEKE